MPELAAFLAITAVLLVISHASLSNPGSHGFYRFFSWEFMAALFLLNARSWFAAPFTWHQLISWTLLTVSLILVVVGVQTLVSRGRPSAEREEEPHLLAFERTTALVTSGVYRFIRHPLYSSLLFLTWGIFFKHPGWIGLFLAAAASVTLTLTAQADEQECIRYFGQPYQDYIKHSKRFIPYLF
jgi:protein-S-isoprenylcysteine O-methyltransferase Ste14